MELYHKAKTSGRLSGILREEMGMSLSLMNKLKWQQRLLVNNIPRHTDFPVQAGDEILALLPDPAVEYPAEDGPLTVLYEDDYLLAVDKPAGMLIHPSRACNTGTLANFVQGYYRGKGVSCPFHPVTRLDRDTFGVVLIGKNAHIHRLLHLQNSQGKLEKTYHALVLGCPDTKTGVIDAPIARREKPSLLRYVDDSGKPSVTTYEVIEDAGAYSRLALHPITGRTHQLRVHCAYMGFPILGDPQYGNEDSGLLSRRMGLTTQALCAKGLRFIHPISGETMDISSGMDVQTVQAVL